MKIVIATAVYYPQTNGVAMFSHSLAVGLARRGYEVMVLCPSQTGQPHTQIIDGVQVVYLKSVAARVYPDQVHRISARRKVLGVKWPRLFYRHSLRVAVHPTKEVRQALDKFQPDVVHVQVEDLIGRAVVAWARGHSVPVVTTEHNQPEVLTNSLKLGVLKGPVNVALTRYFRKRHSKSDFVTMPTEKAIRGLIGKRDLGVPIAAVSNGVDLANFRPGEAEAKIYEKYGIKQGVPIVLYVGRIDPEKRVGVVIEAFKKARKEVPTAEMVIVGDGVDKARLEQKYGLKDGVKFLGRVVGADLYELYKVGWVFATASEIETQGIVLIEAAATGLPLIAVDAGAVAEVCVDGENGYLCEPRSVVEIAAAMAKILTEEKLRRKFAQKSLEIAKTHDFETTLDRFINIYEKVTKNSPNRG